MNYEEIAAMLADGKSADEIAAEFTKHLNTAIAVQKEVEAAKKAEEEAKQKDIECRKVSLTDSIADAINEYAALSGYSDTGITGTEVREVVDSVIELAGVFKDLHIEVKTEKPSKKFGIAGKGKASTEDIFADFFKSIGI